MPRGLPQAPVSGIRFKWRGTRVARPFSFPGFPPKTPARQPSEVFFRLAIGPAPPVEAGAPPLAERSQFLAPPLAPLDSPAALHPPDPLAPLPRQLAQPLARDTARRQFARLLLRCLDEE